MNMPCLRAHNLMRDMIGMVDWLMKEGGGGPDYVQDPRATPAGVSPTAWPINSDTPTQAKDDNSHFLNALRYSNNCENQRSAAAPLSPD